MISLVLTIATAMAPIAIRRSQSETIIPLCYSNKYALAYTLPRGWTYDDHSHELVPSSPKTSGPIFLGCSLPPRDRSYDDFDARVAKEISVLRKMGRGLRVRHRHLGLLPATEARVTDFMGHTDRLVIETYVGVPDEDGRGELFVIGVEVRKKSDEAEYLSIYEDMIRSSRVIRIGDH